MFRKKNLSREPIVGEQIEDGAILITFMEPPTATLRHRIIILTEEEL